jgi:hypothetical protein
LALCTAALVWAFLTDRVPARADKAHFSIQDALPDAQAQAARPADKEERGRPAAGVSAAGVGVVTEEALPGVELVPIDVVAVDGEDGTVFRCATTSVPRSATGSVRIKVDPYDGYVADRRDAYDVEGYASRRADRVRVVVPLRREADLRIRVVDAGRPVKGARLGGVHWGGGAPQFWTEGALDVEPPSEVVWLTGPSLPDVSAGPTDRDGWTRIRGVPHLLDEQYWVVVGASSRAASTGFRLGAFGERHEAEVRLPAASTETVVSFGIGGGAGGGNRGRGGDRYSGPLSSLEVLVRRLDGRMAAGIDVWVGGLMGTTDGAGRAVFDGLPPRSYGIEVRDPDFVWSSTEVELKAGERRTLVLSEPTGWTARAVLFDSVGRPVPFARVTVACFTTAPVEYVRVNAGVQDWVFYTDVTGAIELPDMHHAPATLTFFYGSRSATVTVEADQPFAEVRLPPP